MTMRESMEELFSGECRPEDLRILGRSLTRSGLEAHNRGNLEERDYLFDQADRLLTRAQCIEAADVMLPELMEVA